MDRSLPLDRSRFERCSKWQFDSDLFYRAELTVSDIAPKDPGEGLPVNDAADIQGFSIFFLGFYRFIFVRLNRIVGSHVLKFGSVTGLMVP